MILLHLMLWSEVDGDSLGLLSVGKGLEIFRDEGQNLVNIPLLPRSSIYLFKRVEFFFFYQTPFEIVVPHSIFTLAVDTTLAKLETVLNIYHFQWMGFKNMYWILNISLKIILCYIKCIFTVLLSGYFKFLRFLKFYSCKFKLWDIVQNNLLGRLFLRIKYSDSLAHCLTFHAQ